MFRSRPPSRPAHASPPGLREPGDPMLHIRAVIAANLRLTIAISLCILAGALFVPSLVLGAEEPEPAPGEEVSVPLPATDTDSPIDESTTADEVTADAAAADEATTADEVTAADEAAVTSVAAETLLVTLPWGSGDGQVGLRRPTEGLTQGPDALAVAPNGRVAVLDSVNCRVVFLDPAGQVVGSTAIPLVQARFLAVDDERVYVLDCDADRRLVTCDWNGAVLGTLALSELPDVVTGLFATTEGPCIEVAHETSFLVSSPGQDGWSPRQAAQAAGVQAGTAGKPAKPGQMSLRALIGRPMDGDLGWVASVTFKPGQNPRVRSFNLNRSDLTVAATYDDSPAIALGRAVEHLVSVDGDGNGGLIVGARLEEPAIKEGRPARLVLSRLASTGAGDARLGMVEASGESMLLVESSFAYLGQPYAVAPDGRIFQPVGSEAGYSIYVHAFGVGGGDTAAATGEVQP